jgi:serine/threonine protein kinase
MEARVCEGMTTICGRFKLVTMLGYGADGAVYSCQRQEEKQCARVEIGNGTTMQTLHGDTGVTQRHGSDVTVVYERGTFVADAQDGQAAQALSSALSSSSSSTTSSAYRSVASDASSELDDEHLTCDDLRALHARIGAATGTGDVGVQTCGYEHANVSLVAKVYSERARHAAAREVALLRRVGVHPNIASVVLAKTSVHTADARAFDVVVKPRAHCDLYDYLEEYAAVHKTCMPEPVLRGIFVDVMRGLAHLHAHGFIHGDVKAENVLLVFGQDGLLAPSAPEPYKSLGGSAHWCDGSGASPAPTHAGAGGTQSVNPGTSQLPLPLPEAPRVVDVTRRVQRALLTDFTCIFASNVPVSFGMGTSWYQAPENVRISHALGKDYLSRPPEICRWQERELERRNASGAISRRHCFAVPMDIWCAGAMLCLLSCLRLPLHYLRPDVGAPCRIGSLVITPNGPHDPYVHLSKPLRDLLDAMMHPDPSLRPSAAAVLAFPWCQQS